MVSNLYRNKEGDFSKRQGHLHSGTLFDAYQWRNGFKKSGRRKMIVRNTFEGFLGTHVC